MFDRAVFVASVRIRKRKEVLRTSCISSSVISRKERRQVGKEIAFDNLPLIVSSAHYVWLRDIS